MVGYSDAAGKYRVLATNTNEHHAVEHQDDSNAYWLRRASRGSMVVARRAGR